VTLLSDTLTARQRADLAELERAYVAEEITPDEVIDGLQEAGITDTIHIAFLLTSLSILRAWGVGEPTMAARLYLVDHASAAERTEA